jgi:glycosyltransferase involved in cell wall biosynthesis
LNLLKALLYRGADEITVVSDGVKKDLMTKLRIPVDRISVVHNPIDIEEIREKATLPIPHPWFREDVPIILGVGRLVHEKDFRTLIDAFQQVRVSHPSRLVILGEGPLRRNLEKQIRELSLQDHVLLPGYDPNPFPYMARATVFVLSSRDEGLPNVLLQSMACETPVIATRCHSGPEEIITNGSDGLLVPVGDSAAMAGAIVSVLESPELQRQLVAKARESMRRFSAEVVLERYTEAAWPYVSPRNNDLHSESQWRAQNKNSR